ncbi:MAG: hypothetical protein ACPLZ9_06600 [Candidatus Ratteibacteria bacterium]
MDEIKVIRVGEKNTDFEIEVFLPGKYKIEKILRPTTYRFILFYKILILIIFLIVDITKLTAQDRQFLTNRNPFGVMLPYRLSTNLKPSS